MPLSERLQILHNFIKASGSVSFHPITVMIFFISIQTYDNGKIILRQKILNVLRKADTVGCYIVLYAIIFSVCHLDILHYLPDKLEIQ